MVGLSRLKSLLSLGQTMRGLVLILVSLIHFHEAKRCRALPTVLRCGGGLADEIYVFPAAVVFFCRRSNGKIQGGKCEEVELCQPSTRGHRWCCWRRLTSLLWCVSDDISSWWDPSSTGLAFILLCILFLSWITFICNNNNICWK